MSTDDLNVGDVYEDGGIRWRVKKILDSPFCARVVEPADEESRRALQLKRETLDRAPDFVRLWLHSQQSVWAWDEDFIDTVVDRFVGGSRRAIEWADELEERFLEFRDGFAITAMENWYRSLDDDDDPSNNRRRTDEEWALEEGGREVMPGLVALTDKERSFGANYLACYYAYIVAEDDDDAFDRMVRLREVFAEHGYASDNGLKHLSDADGC